LNRGSFYFLHFVTFGGIKRSKGASRSLMHKHCAVGQRNVTLDTTPQRRTSMAKGQQRSNKEARKPKKAKVKTIAANPSQKGGQRGLENLEHLKNS